MKITVIIAIALFLMAAPAFSQTSTTDSQYDDNDGFDWGWLGLLGLLGLLPRRGPDRVIDHDRGRVTTTTRP